MMRLLRPYGARNDKGFTLIEMVLTIALGAVLLTGLGRAAQSQMKSAIDNRDFLVALHLAKRQMAITNLGTYPAVAAEAALSADASFPNFIPTREVISVDTSGGNSIREIRIRIRRGTSTGPVLVMLVTYRSNIISAGNGI